MMSNKTILITGGTAGIGRALAEHLLAAGNKVIITGRNQARVDEASKQLGCMGFVADSTDSAQLASLASSLHGDRIKLDGLVLNAGVFYPQSVLASQESDFDLTMAANTKGPLITLQQLQPLLNNPSSVVFVSSVAVTRAFAGAAVYAASKAAFEAIARVANLELASLGIRINSVRPGVTATEIQGKAGMSQEQQDAFFATLQSTPLGRVMTPQDQIGAIAFLLSDQSFAMRNAVLEVDGGYLL
ncbi:SDR family oxidoreductase [Bowmanella denitrificans]|uniref:SDR family oxidoreductase n=1 Tax=Bowmanella denitrificans TaxID=366582 RepID=UPI001FEA8C00|nr:SDR family oxidoreductase [Bowmanella denitrificans]